jgi:hypothetical protein
LLFGDERWPNFVYDVGQTLRKSVLVFVQLISCAYTLRAMSHTDQVEHANLLPAFRLLISENQKTFGPRVMIFDPRHKLCANPAARGERPKALQIPRLFVMFSGKEVQKNANDQ